MLFLLFSVDLRIELLNVTEDMNTLKDWAEYYLSKKVLSCPPDCYLSFKEMESTDIAKATYESLDWEGGYLTGIIGQEGIRAIKLNIQGLDDNEIYILVKYVIKTIYDIKIYPWVVREGTGWMYIIVESNNIIGQGNVSYGGVILLWQGNFPLPALMNTVNFYFKGIPTISPMHVEGEKLFECIDKIKEFYSVLKEGSL